MIDRRYQYLALLRSEIMSAQVVKGVPVILLIMHDMRLMEMERYLGLKR
jgi:hypothetical protein